jgi:hypothetical protein
VKEGIPGSFNAEPCLDIVSPEKTQNFTVIETKVYDRKRRREKRGK